MEFGKHTCRTSNCPLIIAWGQCLDFPRTYFHSSEWREITLPLKQVVLLSTAKNKFRIAEDMISVLSLFVPPEVPPTSLRRLSVYLQKRSLQLLEWCQLYHRVNRQTSFLGAGFLLGENWYLGHSVEVCMLMSRSVFRLRLWASVRLRWPTLGVRAKYSEE